MISDFETKKIIAQSAGAVEYTDCFSTPTSVLDMTFNDLMVRFQ